MYNKRSPRTVATRKKMLATGTNGQIANEIASNKRGCHDLHATTHAAIVEIYMNTGHANLMSFVDNNNGKA